MSTCDDKRPLLTALFDGELDAANAFSLEQHVAACAGCAATLERWRRVRETLTPDTAYRAPEAFRRRLKIAVEQQCRSQGGQRIKAANQGLAPAWIGALGAIAACAVVLVSLNQLQSPLTEELVADHVRSLLAEHLTDVATSDRHVVKPWFDGKVSFAPTVQDFADQGFPLVGGRLDYLAGQRTAALVYRRRLHVINVFVRPKAGLIDEFVGERSSKGYNLISWSVDGLSYFAVSDLDPAQLRQFREINLATTRH